MMSKTKTPRFPMAMRAGASALALTIATASAAVLTPGVAVAEQEVVFTIPAQPLSKALVAFGVQANTTVAFTSAQLAGKVSHEVSGSYKAAEALGLLLAESGFTYEFLDEKTVRIAPIEANSSAATTKTDDQTFMLEEIVVTASKRETGLQDIAMSITAIGSKEMERKSLVNMQDYLPFVPGVTMQDFGAGRAQLVMRGLATGIQEQATVTTYFGEVPLTNPLGGLGPTDMKLVDMARVEVLRGPQGTLYGSGALGGAVRNIPNAPDLSEFNGKIELDYSHTQYSDSDNANVVGVVNIPLIEDELAIRIAAYRYDNAGYIDLVSNDFIENTAQTTGTSVQVQDDTGSTIYSGIRASILWKLTEKLDATLILAQQKLEEDGFLSMDISSGKYQAHALRTENLALGIPTEGESDNFKLANLVVNYDFEWATLTSSTTKYKGEFDYVFSTPRAALPWAAASLIDDTKEAFMQEVRLASNLEGPFQYIAGAYYEDFDFGRSINFPWYGSLDSLVNTFASTDRNLFVLEFMDSAEQFALFGEAYYQLTNTVKLVAGGRWFDYTRDTVDQQSGLFAAVAPPLSTEENGSIFKAGIDYAPNDDTLLYASWSQGFRLGRGVAPVSPASQALCDTNNDGLDDELGLPFDGGIQKSDKTSNYEVGGKFSLMDKRLTANIAIFHIDWTELPILLLSTAGCQISSSAGSARSQGVEFEGSYYVTESLQVNIAASYTDAKITSDGIPALPDGSRLPMSAKVNGGIGLQYEFFIAEREAFIRGDLSYIGDYVISPGVPLAGDYVKLDMRAGIALDQFDIELYGKNLTGADNITTLFQSTNGWRVTPRTVGVNIRYHF